MSRIKWDGGNPRRRLEPVGPAQARGHNGLIFFLLPVFWFSSCFMISFFTFHILCFMFKKIKFDQVFQKKINLQKNVLNFKFCSCFPNIVCDFKICSCFQKIQSLQKLFVNFLFSFSKIFLCVQIFFINPKICSCWTKLFAFSKVFRILKFVHIFKKGQSIKNSHVL